MRKESDYPCTVGRNAAQELLTGFEAHLRSEERSANTITKYVRDLRAFFSFLNGGTLDKEAVRRWKESLTETHAPTSVNSMLAAVSRFLDWLDLPQFKVKPLKLQRDLFCKPEKELSRAEYVRLVQAAERRRSPRLALLLQTICATGIRVSELRFITVEALKTGRAVVGCKGKCRTVFLPQDLCRALRRRCRELGIPSGAIFRTKSGKPLDRSNIWREMKALCQIANVEPSKVFPHNLRHLFARAYYQQEKDLSRLADLLGHSNVSTTRIYTMESGAIHAKQLDRMGLVLTRT